MRAAALLLGSLLVSPAPPSVTEGGALTKALADATSALDAGDLPRTRAALDRVLERDPNSLPGWNLVERWAEKAGDRDEQVHALNRELGIARASGADKPAQEAIRSRLLPVDPVAAELAKLRT